MTQKNQTYSVTAFRWERWSTHRGIDAASPAEAIAKMREYHDKGELDFNNYAEDSQDADCYTVNGDELELVLPGLLTTKLRIE